MRTLLLQLPTTPASPAALYGMAEFDLALPPQQAHPSSTPLALLPRAQRQTEIVAQVPAALLSWHRVTLPPGLGRSSAKLLAALQGLLEDRLLQDPQQVHLALAPQWTSGSPCWVAACDKAWLQTHLQALHDAHLPVQRIVPELAPPDSGQHWHALGDETEGWLWCCDAEHGVSGWPVAASAQLPSDWVAPATLQAEPGLVRWAQAHDVAQVTLTDRAAHWQTSTNGAWNLAQFDLQTDARTRRLQGLRRALNTLARHRHWRPARWGLVALLVSQLLGLQAWAWMTRQQWQAEQDQWGRMLLESFPNVSVVVDAPLQMAREVSRLRQVSGQLMPQDFESQLSALDSAWPPDAGTPMRLNYQDGQLQWPVLSLDAAENAAFAQALQRRGYRLLTEEGVSRLQALEVRP